MGQLLRAKYGLLPSGHVDVNVPFSTVSAVLVDVTGMVITVTTTTPCKILCGMTGEASITGGGTATTIGYAINIDGTDSDEQHVDLTNSDADTSIDLEHIPAAVFQPGTHTAKLRMRRVSGTQTVQFTSGMLTVIGLQTIY